MKRSRGSCENIAANGMTAPSRGPAGSRPRSLTFSKEAKCDRDASSIKPILHFSLGEDYSRVLKGGPPLSLSTHLMVHEVLFVLCTLLLCQSGFREVWEFGVGSSGDSNRALVLFRVVFSEMLMGTLCRWKQQVFKCKQDSPFCVLSSSRHHNKIRTIDGGRIAPLVSVETLDLSNNDITELRGYSFPAGLQIKDL